MNLCYTHSLKQSRFSSIEGKKGAPKRDRMFVVFILSNVFELHARLVTPLTFEPITSAVIWKIRYSNLCIRFGTWWERRMNQPLLQRRIVRQSLPNLMLFAAPNLICRTELIQTPLFFLIPHMWCYDAYFVANTSWWRNSWRNTGHSTTYAKSKKLHFWFYADFSFLRCEYIHCLRV